MVLSIYLLSRVQHFALVKIRVARDEDSVTRLHFALVKIFGDWQIVTIFRGHSLDSFLLQ